MRQPVLILSDLHLGHKGSLLDDVSMLEPMLQGIGTLLLNGDTWQELAKEFRDVGETLLTDLRERCRALDVDLIMLPGNHDPGSGSVGYATLAGGRIAVTHGDCVYAEGAPWSRMAIKKERELQVLWAQATVDTIDQRLELGKTIAQMLVPPWHGRGRHLLQRIWDACMPPGRGLRMLLSWWHMVDFTRRFAKRYLPQSEIIVCGHFHRAGIWEQQDLLVVNTGSFMPPGAAYWCEWNQSYFTVGRIEKIDETFQRGEILGVWHLAEKELLHEKTKEGGESFGS